MFRSGNHPDFFFLQPPEGKSKLSIEQFLGSDEKRGREGLLHDLSLKAVRGGWRIAVIDQADGMNTETTNAFLKTLEEPPSGVLLILIVSNADALLPTIRSRCQLIRFGPLQDSDVAQIIGQLRPDANSELVKAVVPLAGGSVETCLQLLEPAILHLRETVIAFVTGRQRDPLAFSAEIMNGLEEAASDSSGQRQLARQIIGWCIEHFRNQFLTLALQDEEWPLEENRFDSFTSTVDRLLHAIEHTEQNVSLTNVFESLAVSLQQQTAMLAAR